MRIEWLAEKYLKRLDEEPLRLVEENSHGSPWSEMLTSRPVAKALDAFPELKDRIVGITQEALARMNRKQHMSEQQTEME